MYPTHCTKPPAPLGLSPSRVSTIVQVSHYSGPVPVCIPHHTTPRHAIRHPTSYIPQHLPPSSPPTLPPSFHNDSTNTSIPQLSLVHVLPKYHRHGNLTHPATSNRQPPRNNEPLSSNEYGSVRYHQPLHYTTLPVHSSQTQPLDPFHAARHPVPSQRNPLHPTQRKANP
ncbi:hypothetical protein CC80DRAFT_491051 [Byssothecium circinans]|uniref:Uncharacterized protein n=1 Tax=Byssothecium circinans TaxID=147558 RepID=A0A6A5U2H2_9PLEO|nr:hypothetical protein CC80DRAFT_491051 [Byssothecium circinans]